MRGYTIENCIWHDAYARAPSRQRVECPADTVSVNLQTPCYVTGRLCVFIHMLWVSEKAIPIRFPFCTKNFVDGCVNPQNSVFYKKSLADMAGKEYT